MAVDGVHGALGLAGRAEMEQQDDVSRQKRAAVRQNARQEEDARFGDAFGVGQKRARAVVPC